MKKYIKIIIAFFVGIISSCSLDEHNPSTVGLDLSYKYKTGFEGLVNSCYVNLYYLYGKVDGIGPMEMGTDLWTNVGGSETGFILYNSNLNTSLGTLKTIWQGLYSMVNLCNTAIYYAPKVVDFASEEERNAKIAEAYFLRGLANYHIVEQFGDVVLNMQSMVEAGARSVAKRSEEVEFYDLIISDLQFACEHLPINQSERGRASKKAAYAMLAKAALQRTRLGDKERYAEMALDAAEELIKNQVKYGCGLYESDAMTSGYAKLWDGNNNKNNREFLFVEVVDHESALNPEGWNRGRTRQYYEADLKTVAAPWGMTEKSLVYGRANARSFKPTKYLLTGIFDPREDTPDTRFENTFFYKYYTYNKATITANLIELYNKDNSLLGHVIPSSAAKGSESDVKEANYYASIGWADNKLFEGFRNLENDASMAVFTPNWVISTGKKALIPALVNDPSDMFQANGKWVEHVQRKEIYPSLKKFSSIKYAYTEQYHMGDFPILRLGDIYLVAAEAALLYNNDKAKAATYVNTLRKRAALSSRQTEMIVNESDMSINFILAERGRELAGEQWRWYDLKRTGNLSKEYFNVTNPDITEFDPAKHLVRPIPISFLNTISNADEFGTNGY